MYGGKIEKVTFECDNSIIGAFIDRFGNDIMIDKPDDEHFCVSHEVAVSGQFSDGW